MGAYLNPGGVAFAEALNSEIYVDKTEMIRDLNALLGTKQKYVSVSRPRRFGKTMAADMICAYYGRGGEGERLFEGRKLVKASNAAATEWNIYLGKFDVVRLVMTDFLNGDRSVESGLRRMERLVLRELFREYPHVDYYDKNDFLQCMQDVYIETRHRFVIVIDEWDSIFRERKSDKEGQKKYLDFLRDWLKDKEYIALAYITGILPIKKYGKHSALNMFWEYSMTDPQQFAPYVGFTAEEVQRECDERGLNYDAFQQWYDGYRLSNIASSDLLPVGAKVDPSIYRSYEVYSPYSVVKAIMSKQLGNYWNQTETYEALRQYIDWDFDGLREDVAVLMDGARVRVDITSYQNDMTTFHGKDDILTMLIHLGYLGYDSGAQQAFIPNKEVMDVFSSSTKSKDWTMTFRALQNSQRLLEATWACNADEVAKLIEAAHDRASNRTYNSEAGLGYAVQLAYYRAQDYYTVIPEFDSGKGYADLAYIPKSPNTPALLIELKYQKDADSAIAQIHRQKYPDRLEHYKGNLILVGINYKRETKNESLSFKHHSCIIEKA